MFRRILVSLLLIVIAMGSLTALAQEEQWWNVLLLGGDSQDENRFGRTDSMIILSINKQDKSLKMTSILRDSWVNIEGHGMGKINAAQVYGGPDLAVKTVNQSFGLNIEDYIIVNMEDLKQLVDLIGGVELEITDKEMEAINQNGGKLEHAGLVRLNGKEALTYSRLRSIDSDYKRAMRQQNVLIAMAKSVQNKTLGELVAMVDGIKEIVRSTISEETVLSLAAIMVTMDISQVQQYRIPAEGTYESGMFDGVWMIRPDIERNKQLLHDFIYGK